MIIHKLAELQQPDEASLRFTPWGLARMSPEDAADFQQRLIGQFELSGQVPETTRRSFERVRTIYSYGVLCYELYTVAGDQARLVVEQALRDRFLPFYEGTVKFRDGQGNPQSVTASQYDEVYRAIRRDDGRVRGWKLELRSSRAPITFNGELSALLRWARAEGLLDGQRDRVRDTPRAQLRNFVAHPSYHLSMPPDAAAEIRELAAIINRLWGALSGAPLAREIVIVGWDDRTVTWSAADRFSTGPIDGTATCAVLRAAADEDLGAYDSLFEAITSPCEYLWGPGSCEEARAWLNREQPGGDQVPVLDRLFMLRYHGSRLYLPQAVPVAAGLTDQQREGTWYLIRADSPHDAFNHQRQLLSGDQQHAARGHCACPVDTLGDGAWQQVLRLAAEKDADVTPIKVPDLRVPMSGTPRWHEHLGDGNWCLPAPGGPSMP
jgi:hypothetical protein